MLIYYNIDKVHLREYRTLYSPWNSYVSKVIVFDDIAFRLMKFAIRMKAIVDLTTGWFVAITYNRSLTEISIVSSGLLNSEDNQSVVKQFGNDIERQSSRKDKATSWLNANAKKRRKNKGR